MGVTILTDLGMEILIPVCAVVGIAFSLFQWYLVSKVTVGTDKSHSSGDDKNGYAESLIEEEEGINDHNVVQKCAEIQNAISEGATSFLFTMYQYVGVFMVAFAILIFVFLGSVEGFSTKNQPCTYDSTKTCKPALATAVFSTVSFLLGAVTSVVSGFLGMKIATYANARTTLEARKGVGKAFIVAFRSGAVMGFLLAANGLLVLFITILLFKMYYGDDWEGLFEAITGYGLGGSSMALFGRVGGGIYTKAADVGADLVGKVERNIPEDDPRNPAVIADNVGDNVGDIAGMGSDLFGSYAESSCAALVVASISSFGVNHELTAMLYPLLVSSVGILVCLLTTLFATDFFEVKAVKEIEPALKKQLIISTILMTIGIAFVSWIALPSTFTIFNFGVQKEVKNWQLFLCVGVGLWAGLIIGFVTEYYTSNAYSPVQDVADSCRTGAATNVIFGLALGYKSVIIPIFAIAISIFVSFSFAAMYGIAVAALGMLSTIATGLAIDAYGPISDNAGGIAEMAGMSHRIRERTDALDAAGNTTAAIGKGFAIGSAALVSLALFGAFVSRAAISTVDVLTPKVFIGLLVGAMLPYWFSAMTMKSVAERLLVYEYMKNGALFDHLHDKNNVEKTSSIVNSWKMRIKIALDAARGIEYLHNYAVPPIIHRDIKSSNILIDGNWIARVSDFGLSLMGDHSSRPMKAAGTVGYIDPEYYGLNVLTAKSDVYGLGVVLLELLTGKRAIFKSEENGGAPMSVVDYGVAGIMAGELNKILDKRVGTAEASEEVPSASASGSSNAGMSASATPLSSSMLKPSFNIL